jgi:hypothetical protein
MPFRESSQLRKEQVNSIPPLLWSFEIKDLATESLQVFE